MSINYNADIYDADSDSLVSVDIRDLDADALAALRAEAAAAGDTALVRAIDSI